jgi:hypothetical protein
MTENPRPFTHTAFLFIRTAVRKGRVYGYWKDGGRFKLDSEAALSRSSTCSRAAAGTGASGLSKSATRHPRMNSQRRSGPANLATTMIVAPKTEAEVLRADGG